KCSQLCFVDGTCSDCDTPSDICSNEGQCSHFPPPTTISQVCSSRKNIEECLAHKCCGWCNGDDFCSVAEKWGEECHSFCPSGNFTCSPDVVANDPDCNEIHSA